MKLSLILMVWNTSHLLKRTLFTLNKQTLPANEWELIIIDDNSLDDVERTVRLHYELPNARVIRLDHDFGMRGNTVAINRGIRESSCEVVMWSTPEVMLPNNALAEAYAEAKPGIFVTIPSHGLTFEKQLRIDNTHWQMNLNDIAGLYADEPADSFDSKWFWLNFYEDGLISNPKRKVYGNNQTVAVHRESWIEQIGYFPLFLDYGSDDPWVSGVRSNAGYKDVTLWHCEAYHQWHTTIKYWMAKGYAPNWNRHGHTTVNHAGDERIPPNGTCGIWDNGDTSKMPQEEALAWLHEENKVFATGFSYKFFK